MGLHCEVIEVNEHNDDDDDIPSNRGNFLDILDAFAKIDPILKEHLSNSKRNAKMTTWMVQNDIISCIAQFIRNRIKEIIARENYYAFIADGVTDRYANKEVLLVCLRYVNYLNGKPKIEEAFFIQFTYKVVPQHTTLPSILLTSFLQMESTFTAVERRLTTGLVQ